MPMIRRLAASLVAIFLFSAETVLAADQSAPAQNNALLIDGKVKHPQRLSADALHRLPAERVDVSFQTAHGIEKSSYTGVLLWRLLDEAGGIDYPAKGAELRHTISTPAGMDTSWSFRPAKSRQTLAASRR
jgi:hypothetical protein